MHSYLKLFQGLEVTPANLARALSAVDPTLWAPPARPATLSLSVPQPCPDQPPGKFPINHQLIRYEVPNATQNENKSEESRTIEIFSNLFAARTQRHLNHQRRTLTRQNYTANTNSICYVNTF